MIEEKKGHDIDELDCPLRVGNTLILAEAKGQRLRFEAGAVARQSIEDRWKDSRGYLDKIDDTAKKVAERREEKDYREVMSGIERILPMVCRPYPEWIPSLDDRYWLRTPTQDDPGVPRVLTLQELKEFLESAEESELANLPGGYVVEVDTLS